MDGGKTDKALEIFGPAYLKNTDVTAMGLTQYAGFWINKKQNVESALEALETSLKKALESADTMNTYAIQNAARNFALAGKPERLLEFYGPDYIKTQWDVPTSLSNYARFWAERKTNLESALAASERALSLKEPYVVNMPFHWSSRSAVYQAMGRLEDAKKAMEKAVEFSVNSGMGGEYYKTQLKKIQDEIDKKK
jgi:tetratricopeptide (TPR) repeat protein